MGENTSLYADTIKLDDCAYAHPSSRSSTRQDTMEKEINILKEEVEKLTVGNALIIDKLNHIEI